MKTPPLVQNVLLLWEKLTNSTNFQPREIVHLLSKQFRINPIPITLIGQQSLNYTVREDAIQAYYTLMEEDMAQKIIMSQE